MGYPIGESEVNSNEAKYFYLFGTELLARINADTEEVHFYLDDYRGNIVAMTDEDGNITHKYEYDAYGNILNIEEADYNPFRFMGSYGVMHETHNLYYVRARYLDSENFVFLQEDPVWAENLYTYARGNPVNFTDPSGEFVPLVVIGVILLEAALQTATDAAIDEGVEALGGPEATWKTHATSFALNLVPGVGEINTVRKGVTLAKTAIDVKKASNVAKTTNSIDKVKNVQRFSDNATIRNGHLAGSLHPKTKVPFNKNGFPDFSAHLYSKGKNDILINLSRNRVVDEKLANQAAGYIKTPKGYTWHHHQEIGRMQLVKSKIHRKTGHTGGFSLFKK